MREDDLRSRAVQPSEDDQLVHVAGSGAVAARDMYLRGQYVAGRDLTVVRQAESGPAWEELLHGPIKALHLESVLAEAEMAASTHPDRAATLYKQLAAVLQERGHFAPAGQMRERRASVLQASGRPDEAFTAWLELAQTDVESGRLFSRALNQLEGLVNDLGPTERASHDAIQGFVAWHEHTEQGLDQLQCGFKILNEAGHPLRARAAMWLAEAALVDEHLELLAELGPILIALAGEANDDVAVRLRLAAAEVDGLWDGLVRDATTGVLGSRAGTLVHARHGRWLAWRGVPREAEEAYRCAVMAGTAAGLYGDVAEFMHAMGCIRQRYGPIDTSLEQLHQRAEAVPSTPTYLGDVTDPLLSGLARLQEGKPDLAHFPLRHHLWRTVVSGHLLRELQVNTLLGDLYASNQALPDALGHYIRAGQAKKARMVAGSLPHVDPRGYLRETPPWEQAVALAALAAQGDLLTAEEVRVLVPDLVIAARGVQQGPFGPQVHTEALASLASMSVQVPEDQLEAVLAVLEPMIPGAYDGAGDALATALINLYCAHPSARNRIGELLVRCLDDDLLGQRLLGPIGSWGDEFAAPLLPSLRARADAGNWIALRILARLDDRHPTVLTRACDQVAQVLALRPIPGRREHSFGNAIPEAAIAALLLPEGEREDLARHLVVLARDIPENITDIESNRASALYGLSTLVPSLSSTCRAELFPEVFAFTDPRTPLHHLDVLNRASTHPLSRFKFSFGVGELFRAALIAAARLAVTYEQRLAVEALIRQVLRSTEPGELRAARLAIEALIKEGTTLDVRLLAAHNSSQIRRAAVRLWVRQPTDHPELGEAFAADEDREVRLALVFGLVELSKSADDIADHLRDQLSKDPSARVRWTVHAEHHLG
jgi:hypothetical protein